MAALKRLTVLPNGTVQYSRIEERIHVLSHMAGILMGVVMLLVVWNGYTTAIGRISGTVFACSLLLLYSASCLYHGMPAAHPKIRRAMQVIDHCSIFVLIAGTGTPFILCSMSTLSISVAAFYNVLMWGCAIVGIILLTISLKRFKRLSIVLYLIMGFSVLVQHDGLQAALGSAGYSLLIGGGLIYCIGLTFYSVKVQWTHAIFHVLCLVASVMHCVCVVLYVI